MTDAQQREAARQFFYRWNGKGREDEDARSYWIELLTNIIGMENMTEKVEFEKKLIGDDGNTKRIDVYIPETRVLIEQKSLGIILDKPQSGHNGMTPYEQAKYYDNYLPFDEKARWIITSNFAEIWIYDMNMKKPDPVKLSLADLQVKYHLLEFLSNKETKKISDEMEISLQAGEIVGLLYDAFHKQYKNPDDPDTLKSLNKLCVRIVFCLYGEDASIFGKKNMFHDYMEQFDVKSARKGLRDLFRVLNQKPEDRDPYLADDDALLAAFPYVNGGLFDGDDIEIPPFTDEIMDLILRKASDDFDWSGISPTIFGAVFESTLNPETRRSGGMHYTSLENIHKVIDPLFLDDLKREFDEIKEITVLRTQTRKLHTFQDKLASLSFLDPAAGSGNFLTESYTSLRKIENDVIRLLTGGQISFGEMINPIKVSISQFYGIEINDFAVTVARTALWIAENQMMKETEDIVHMQLDFLPLKTNANIVEGNALRMDWENVVPKSELDYICGNPPFVGYSLQSPQQKKDILSVYIDEKGKSYKASGKIDYVSGWYFKASEMLHNTNIRAAFVSTNSITQGEQVSYVWKPLYDRFKIHIDFAYRTFIWESEASQKAHVHCVIIGFSSNKGKDKKKLFEDDRMKEVDNINPYLIAAADCFVENRTRPICNVPKISSGFKPADNGYLILNEDEKNELISKEPDAEKWIRPYSMGVEFIRKIPRYCLWLEDIKPNELQKLPLVKKRVSDCREWRANATKTGDAYKLKDIPHLFRPCKQFRDVPYIAIPLVSSQNRRYIPMGFIDNGMIPGNNLFSVFEANLYHFGILTSNVHMSWMRAFGGRLKSDYRYSTGIVYNCFAWPAPSEDQRAMIEQTAQQILDARDLYPDASLADLYDPLTMPQKLRKAHQANDKAVMQAYGMPIKETDEAACVAWLMNLYQEKTHEKVVN